MRLTKSFLFFCLFFLSCNEYNKKKKSIYQKVPQNTFSLIQINESLSYKEIFNYNTVRPFLPKNKSLIDLSSILNEIEDEVSLISFSSIGKNKFSTTLIQTKTNDSLSLSDKISSYSGYDIYKIKIHNTVFYKVILDNNEIVSDSKLTIENVIRNYNSKLNGMNNEEFYDLIDTFDTSSSLNLLVNKEIYSFANEYISNIKLIPTLNENWIALDVNKHLGTFKLDGITYTKDSIPTKISVLSGMKPQLFKAVKIIPKNFKSFISFPLENIPQLIENLKRYSIYHNIPIEYESLKEISSIDEINIVDFEKGLSIFMHKSNETNDIINQNKLNKSYRNIKYGAINEVPNGIMTFLDFFDTDFKVNYAAQFDNYILFADSESLIKSIISNNIDGNTIKNDINFSSLMDNLSSESSGIWIYKTKHINKNIKTTDINFNHKKFPLAAIQWINDNGFAHMHLRFGENKPQINKNKVINVGEIIVNSKISTTPQWLKNHRTKGYDIAFQDENNILYLYSNNGKLFWKKQLKEKIIGKISQVDLYKNKRLQMAFRTKNRFIILDRNGKIVKPFDIKIDGDSEALPLSVFDYENNKNYRFLLAQKKNLIMLNSKGKRVKGFKYKKLNENLTFPPKHIRIKGKDFIVLKSKDKLRILNRRGESALKIDYKISFSNNPVWKYLNTFTTSDKQGNLIQIDTKGNIIKSPENWSENHMIEMTTKTLVSISENTITIKGIPIKLPYGNYTRPKIFYLNNKLYVNTTDKDSQKVYLFDSNGNTINGFPIYGTETADIIENTENDSLELIVQSEANGIIIYRFN